MFSLSLALALYVWAQNVLLVADAGIGIGLRIIRLFLYYVHSNVCNFHGSLPHSFCKSVKLQSLPFYPNAVQMVCVNFYSYFFFFDDIMRKTSERFFVLFNKHFWAEYKPTIIK